MADFLLGNDLIALAAVHAGAHSAYSYPGTPASEILGAFRRFAPDRFAQWSVNEKVALELSTAEAISGKSVLCAMKQVGLNVAADPLFSVAYTGVAGALVLVSADDPGPHSSQTEQDSRLYALSARIPVFDPANPRDAWALTLRAFALSAREKIPVLLRPVMRVCHSRQDFEIPAAAAPAPVPAAFVRDPERWAATPRFRSVLHERLLAKLSAIAADAWRDDGFAPKHDLAVVASGYPYAVLRDVLAAHPLPVDLVKVDMPFPLSGEFAARHLAGYRRLLVAEETFPVIEDQLRDRGKVSGKHDGAMPARGELTFDILSERLHAFAGKPAPKAARAELPAPPPPAKPRLCAGCGHRPAFYAIRKSAPDGIFPGDIGCYTLGVNLGAVDSCICMGASITFAEAMKRANPDRPVIATIGDSTFFHTGLPGLLNARLSGAPVVLCILDNGTTAMTGFQPVPHMAGAGITIEAAVRGLGIDFVRAADPYDVQGAVALLKEALAHAEEACQPAVVIFRRGCVARERPAPRTAPVRVTGACRNCRICYERFECPALSEDPALGRPVVDRRLCIDCGVCVDICPFGAIAAGEDAP